MKIFNSLSVVFLVTTLVGFFDNNNFKLINKFNNHDTNKMISPKALSKALKIDARPSTAHKSPQETLQV
jgi:hypothetical protein